MKNGFVPNSHASQNVRRIKADCDKGLTLAQVKARKAEGLDNRPVDSPSKSVKEIIADNVFTYFNLLFLILTLLLIFVGSYRDITFMPIIIANALKGFWTSLLCSMLLSRA